MSDYEWTAIPGRLRDNGYPVYYERLCYDPEHPLWCAKATRGGQELSTVGEDVPAALFNLQKQMQTNAENGRK